MRRREIEAGLTSWDGEVTRQPFCRRSPGRRQSHVVVAHGKCGVDGETERAPKLGQGLTPLTGVYDVSLSKQERSFPLHHLGALDLVILKQDGYLNVRVLWSLHVTVSRPELPRKVAIPAKASST